MTKKEGDPRILLIDIETFPMLMYAWEGFKANFLKIKEDTSIASWSAKWLGGKHVTRGLIDYRGYRAGSRNDKKLLADLWKLLDEAKVVVAHNGDRFDVKKLNYRFMVNGLGVPSPYQTVDTLKEARAVCGHDSNRLNELCRVHGIGQKVRTGGKDLWFDCLESGDPKAWARMKRYNAHDVRLLEGWYLFLRPWMKRHPNQSLLAGDFCCPRCGADALQARGFLQTATRRYRRFQCTSCGGWSKSTHSNGGAEVAV